MWVIHLALSLAALYAAIIAGMYFAQTWLLFPAFLARATRVQLPESTQRLKVRTPDGESLVGVRIRGMGAKTDGAPAKHQRAITGSQMAQPSDEVGAKGTIGLP